MHCLILASVAAAVSPSNVKQLTYIYDTVT